MIIAQKVYYIFDVTGSIRSSAQIIWLEGCNAGITVFHSDCTTNRINHTDIKRDQKCFVILFLYQPTLK